MARTPFSTYVVITGTFMEYSAQFNTAVFLLMMFRIMSDIFESVFTCQTFDHLFDLLTVLICNYDMAIVTVVSKMLNHYACKL